MSPVEITTLALALEPRERAELADKLFESLHDVQEDASGSMSPEIEEAWAAVANHRWKEIQEGKVECIPVEDVLREMRARLS